MFDSINLFYEDILFRLPDPSKAKQWIATIISSEVHKAGDINFIFCTDEYIHAINHERLGHDFYTDILTFDLSGEGSLIEGDIFISVERVTENAKTVSVPFLNELLRVMIHGILHLIGFNDKTEEEKTAMREKEDSCLSLYQF